MSKKRRKNKKITRIELILGIVFALLASIYIAFQPKEIATSTPQQSTSYQQQPSASIHNSVTILDVGQADCSLIESDGKFCLIDAAQTDSKGVDVTDYLKTRGVKEIELLVITHFHSDHTSQILNVMDSFKINNILIPNLTQDNMPTSKFFSKFLDVVEQKNISIHTAKKGNSYIVGSGVITVADDTINDMGINNTSVATLFTQGNFSYLNTGDAEWQSEDSLALNVGKVTLFKAGHHGSSTSNTEKLLNIIKPDKVAVSAGTKNSYGHPHQEAMDNFNKIQAQVNITFQDGTLVYSIDTSEIMKGEG